MKQANIPKIRKVDFHIDEIPLEGYWFANNALVSHLLNSMHLVFPKGEQFFIRNIRNFSQTIDNKTFRKRIRGFIGQETIHSKEHQKFYSYLQKKGYQPETFLNIYEKIAYDLLENILNVVSGKRMGLAMTAALEHHTAIMADGAFHSRHLHRMPDNMRSLLLWHAAEEIEHKSVAYDVLNYVDDSYLLRICGMVIATIFLIFWILAGGMYLLWQDRQFTCSQLLADVSGFSGLLTNLGNHYLQNFWQYFHPDFHPDHIDNKHLIEGFLS